VGEEGRELSGGQRQRGRDRARPARRRAGARPRRADGAPRPAAAERLVDDVLDAAGGRTVLLITHRPEGLDRMDEVLVLDGGRVRPQAGK
jgi:ABC-type bacteriocin/lantibiotic exporter with double-glycine peptidase domain